MVDRGYGKSDGRQGHYMTAEKIKIVDPEADGRWDAFLLKHQDSTIYHHSLWGKVIRETYRYEPFYIILEDGLGRIKGGIPFFFIKSRLTGDRLVSLPFSDFCEVLVESQDDLVLLLKYALEKAEELHIPYVEIRTRNSRRFFTGGLFKERNYFKNHVLDLSPDPEEIRRRFHKDCIQRNIKKAERSCLAVVEGKEEKDMKTFYHLHSLTRKKHGLPPQPYHFFKNIWKILFPRKVLRLLLAREDDRMVAAMLFFKYRDTLYYEYGSSDSRHLHNKPNHFLMWKAIEMACQEGLKHFDLGRTAPEDTGLVDFKRRWGAREYELPYFCYPEVKGPTLADRRGWKYRMVNRFSHFLPVSFLKIFGRIIYKHLG